MTIFCTNADKLFDFHSNYGSILNHFRNKARYWSEIVIFSYPLASHATVRGSTSEYYHPVWYGNKKQETERPRDASCCWVFG